MKHQAQRRRDEGRAHTASSGLDLIALANPTRRRVLVHLAARPASVAQLARSCHRAHSTIRSALRYLAHRGLVEPVPDNGQHRHRLTDRIRVKRLDHRSEIEIWSEDGSHLRYDGVP